MIAGGPQFGTAVLLLLGTLVFLRRGRFLGTDIREGDEAVRRVGFGQARARSRAGGSFHRRHVGGAADHRVYDDPAAAAEDPVSVAMKGPLTGTTRVAVPGVTMPGMTRVEDRSQPTAVSGDATAAGANTTTDTEVATDTDVPPAAVATGG